MAVGGSVSCVVVPSHGIVDELLLKSHGCPYPGSECSITANIPRLVAHLKDDHKVDMEYGSIFNHLYVISKQHQMQNTTWMLTVFNCFGLQFCLYLESIPTGITPCYIFSMRFMGEKSVGKKYVCCIKFEGNGRELKWVGVPRSISDSHQKVSDDTDGLVIPRNLALLFSCGNEQKLTLHVTGRIWKEY